MKCDHAKQQLVNARCGLDFGQPIERAGRGAHLTGRDLQVARGCGQVPVAEEQLNSAQIGTRFEQMSCESVAQRVWSDGFFDP